MQVEFDPRSESFRVWVSNENEHNFMKLISSPAFDPYRFLKNYQNSIYGKMVSDMGIGEKENDMRIKDFIVLHADGHPVMMKKEAITALSKMSDGTTRVEIYEHIWITDDKYDDVIKRLFEI